VLPPNPSIDPGQKNQPVSGGGAWSVESSLRATFIHALINGRNLFHPSTPVGMFEIQNDVGRPVEVISDEGYLLVQRLEGVA